MIQEKIDYSDIVEAGFEQEILDDRIFLDRYGYLYSSFTKQLTDNVILDWDQLTRLCEMRFVDEHGNIRSRTPIHTVKELEEAIELYSLPPLEHGKWYWVSTNLPIGQPALINYRGEGNAAIGWGFRGVWAAEFMKCDRKQYTEATSEDVLERISKCLG